jgi:hypothetical protein
MPLLTEFLEPSVLQADAYVFSREAFVWDELDPAKRAIIAPSIDVFAPKYAELDPAAVDAVLSTARAPSSGPIAMCSRSRAGTR